MKKIILGSLVMLFVLTGCNTASLGVGKDVSKVGRCRDQLLLIKLLMNYNPLVLSPIKTLSK